LVELIIVPVHGGHFEIGIALARLEPGQFVPLLPGQLELTAFRICLACFNAVLVFGWVDLGHVRKHSSRLIIETVILLSEGTSEIGEPFRIAGLAREARDQITVYVNGSATV